MSNTSVRVRGPKIELDERFRNGAKMAPAPSDGGAG